MADSGSIVYPSYLTEHTKTSFLEVTQYFAKQKVKIVLGTYDKSIKIECFFSVQEARDFAHDIKNGVVRNNLKNVAEIAKAQNTSVDYANIYATQSKGTNGRYRYVAIRKGKNKDNPYVIVGLSGPGRETDKGLMQIAGAPDQQVYIPAKGLVHLADALLDAAQDCNTFTLIRFMADIGALENCGKPRKG